jgi:hypothetical protein
MRREQLGLTWAAGRAHRVEAAGGSAVRSWGNDADRPDAERLAEALEMRLSVQFQPLREAS